MLRKDLMKPCQYCGQGPKWKIVKIIDSNERSRFPYACSFCGKRTTFFVKKKNVPEEILNSEPGKIYQPNLGICQRCNKHTHVEEHHWAPHKFFKDADEWPKSLLCRECHEEWHSLMTGDLIRK